MRTLEERIKMATPFLIALVVMLLLVAVAYKDFFVYLKGTTLEKQKTEEIVEEPVDKRTIEEQIREQEEYFLKKNEIKNITYTAIVYSTIVLLISIVVNFKKPHTRSYDKNNENLLSPVLAETIIDNQIDFKSLIMTTIIELHLKGNLRIVNNETIELLSTQNLESYQEKLICFIFGDRRVISFKEINEVFKKSKEKTFEFSKTMATIKQMIIEKLYNIGIYSRKKTAFAKVMIILSIIILLNFPMMILTQIDPTFKETGMASVALTVWVIYYYIRQTENQLSYRETFIDEGKEILKNKMDRINRKKKETILSRLLFFVVYPILLVFLFKNLINYNIENILLVIFAFALNMFVFVYNRGYSLTKKGYEEKDELIKLKNYINEYSLIKDRDLNSVIVWDEYLAYATAFEIPNKVTDSIYKNWYDINMNIQFVETVVKLLLKNFE